MKRRRRSTGRQAPDLPTNEDEKTKLVEEEEEICETPNIGRDLMFEILVKLPIRCLLRFKTVSKYWFRLISSPEFIKFRLQYACDDPHYAQHKLLKIEKTNFAVEVWQAPLLPMLCDPGSFYHRRENRSSPLEFYEEENRPSAVTFVGTCNGLVCIVGLNHRVVVWNPALRKCKRLPYFGRGSKVVYGFGYDASSDDFKVVGIRNTPKTLVKIYSARADSWKKLEDDGFEVGRVNVHGCFLNGKLHWATQNKSSIMTIDLSSERFGFMEPPEGVRAQECSCWSVHAVGEFLAVFGFYKDRAGKGQHEAQLWVMARYGAQEPWSRVRNGVPDRNWEVICPEGEVLYCHMHNSRSEPGDETEAWRTIPVPGHMTSNAIKAFLLYSVKPAGYPIFNRQEFCRHFVTSQQQVSVYVESLTWPFLGVSRG